MRIFEELTDHSFDYYSLRVDADAMQCFDRNIFTGITIANDSHQVCESEVNNYSHDE